MQTRADPKHWRKMPSNHVKYAINTISRGEKQEFFTNMNNFMNFETFENEAVSTVNRKK
jgi:hypothetical protein